MKYLLSFVMATQLLTAVTFAGESSDVILDLLKSSTEKTVLNVEEETFVFNINGYGCQWPGLRILNMVAEPELNHSRRFAHVGSDESYIAIGLKDPNHQFCHSFGDAAAVFGKELVAGAELPMQIKRVLDLRKGLRMDKNGEMKAVKLIHETITVKVNGRTVETASEISLQKK